MVLSVVFVAAGSPLFAQWTNVPSRGPRTKDGKTDLSAPPPMAPDGKVDLSGIWAIEVEGFSEGLADYADGVLPLNRGRRR